MRLKSKIFSTFEFTQQFIRFLLVDRVMIKKDNLVLITGKRGDGKTTLALKIIMGFGKMEVFEKYYNIEVNKNKEKIKNYNLTGFKPFDLETDMAFTRQGLQDLCRNNSKSFILADEAIVSAARRNSMTKANKILHEVLTINRKNSNTVFLCLPSIEDFDVSMLQYVTHWIHVDDRGLAVVLMPESKSIFGRKTWDIDNMKKTYEKFKDQNPRLLKVPYWLFNNFRGYVRFKKLTAGVERKYLKIANEMKNKDSEEQEKAKIKKIRAPRINDEQMLKLKNLSKELRDGKIVDPAEYYAHCKDFGWSKHKLNKEMNEILALDGDGRPAHRIIKESKKEKDNSYESQLKRGMVIY